MLRLLALVLVLMAFGVGESGAAPIIGSFAAGASTVAPGGYVSLYATSVTDAGSSVAGVRFYRESNSTAGLQAGSDSYVGMGVLANHEWTFAAPTTGLSGSQTYYAVAYDAAGLASAPLSVTVTVSGSGFPSWSTLKTFISRVPLALGVIPSTSVVNFGTTIYTGSLNTTLTLDRVAGDEGPNRSADGGSFTNNGNPPLPTNRGNFYEFTIDPQTGCSPSFTSSQAAFPGPIRFMINTSGDVYFTGDHYVTDLNVYVAGTPALGTLTVAPSSVAAGSPVALNASNVTETISPMPNINANTGSNVLATVTNVQFYLEVNGTSGLQTDTDRLLGSGTQNGNTWTMSNVSTTGLSSGAHTLYAVAYDAAGNTATQTTTLTITSGTPDLTISKTHTGIFTQADTGKTYALTVTNSGTASTSGTVTVTDTLPSGLTATAFSGTGWTTNLGTLTATRSDALAQGSSYPPLTLTVSVSQTAAASVTNIASVSGGGETNTANDSASDITTIVPLTPIQTWRNQWFGNSANSGAGLDTAIAAGDGIPNLLKYALNLTPPQTPATTNGVVVVDSNAGALRLTITKNPAANDLIFSIEGTTNLADPNSWSTTNIVIDQNTSTTLQAHDSSLLTGSPHFLRLKVTRP